MAIKQRFEYEQRPIFSQSLKQSLKVLELSQIELKNTVEEELSENPVIEEVQKKETPESDISPLPSARETMRGDATNYEKPVSVKNDSLTEILLRQLRINAKDERDIAVGTHIINRVDENGYVREDTASLCAGTDYNEKEVSKVLKLVQTFEPAGVGARDLKECLLIQLKRKNENDPLTFKLVEDCIQDLGTAKANKLCKKLKCSEEKLLNSIKKIRSLEPKPGRGYLNEETAYIIPDIIIEEKDNDLNISTKDDAIPVIRVNPVYRNMLKSKKVNDETKNFIRERLRNANSLIAAIQQRKQTLTKVVSIIAETQKEALLEGIDKLKPLTLKEIAAICGLHESTISRVVMNKYVQTPAGIFALRKFFSTSLKTSEGKDISSETIKSKIRVLIENEDKTSPLRDQKIVELLNESQRINISRRTVAKYREILKIPPASQRRRPIV